MRHYDKNHELAIEIINKTSIKSTHYNDLLIFALSHSDYFRNCYENHGEILGNYLNTMPINEILLFLIQEIKQINLDSSIIAIQSQLRTLKHQAQFIAGLGELSQEFDFEYITQIYSKIADACVQVALGKIAHMLETNNIITNGQAIFSIAMGKLGANELNFSSDIDCILIYDEAEIGIKSPENIGIQLRRAGIDFMKILNEYTDQGMVFRTDLRLRPDPSITPLIISKESALRYYQSNGAFWERMAHIKARPHAGNLALGEDYLTKLHPFIFHKNYNYMAYDEIGKIRARIISQIPKFDGILGFNIKLGWGGIRAIEFIIQAMQLVYGGRNRYLHSRASMAALDKLYSYNHISDEHYQYLRSAYYFYRHIEHKLQMMNNAQTHELPNSIQELMILCDFCRENPNNFINKLEFFIDKIQEIENYYFGEWLHNNQQQNQNSLENSQVDELSAIFNHWIQAPYRALRHEKAQYLINKFIPIIANQAKLTDNPLQSVQFFDSYLQSITHSVDFLALLINHPNILAKIFTILEQIPFLSKIISENPLIIEALIANNLDANTEKVIKSACNDNEYIEYLGLEVARVYFELLFNAVQYITDKKDQSAKIIANISEIHEKIFQIATPQIIHHYQSSQFLTDEGDDLAIIAFGRLATKTMLPQSDNDCIFVFEASNNCRIGYYTKLINRLCNFFHTIGVHGKMMSIDTRLRPDGEDGAVAVNLESLAEYYHHRAWVWEELALVKARIIYAPPALKEKLQKIIHEILQKKRDKQKIHQECHSMLQKIQEAKKPDFWDFKNKLGGTMQLEFISCALVLIHAHKFPILCQDYSPEQLKNCGIINENQALILTKCHEFYLQLGFALRLVPKNWHELTHSQQKFIMQICTQDTESEFFAKINEIAELVIQLYREILGNHYHLD